MHVKKKSNVLLLALIFGAVFAGIAAPSLAHAIVYSGTSDSETPYLVDETGITLPAGETFTDGGHVNVKTNQGDRGIHFEALNNQPSGQWIGESFLPWSALGFDRDTLCVGWVQLSQYPEHYGEGGQPPVGLGCVVVPTPTPTPDETIVVTPSPTVSVTPTPSVTPSPTVSVTPTPAVTPTPSVTPIPSVSATPVATPTQDPIIASEILGVPETEKLAETGGDNEGIIIVASAVGALLFIGLSLVIYSWFREKKGNYEGSR